MSVDLATLPSMPFAERKMLPELACVYFAMVPDEVLYVGRSKSLGKRWQNHHCVSTLKCLPDARIAWLFVDDVTQLPALELGFIKELKPKLNRPPVSRQRGYKAVSFKCPPDIYAAVAQLAKDDCRKVSNMIVRLLETMPQVQAKISVNKGAST